MERVRSVILTALQRGEGQRVISISNSSPSLVQLLRNRGFVVLEGSNSITVIWGDNPPEVLLN